MIDIEYSTSSSSTFFKLKTPRTHDLHPLPQSVVLTDTTQPLLKPQRELVEVASMLTGIPPEDLRNVRFWQQPHNQIMFQINP